jgi:hypothetical protein
MVLVHVKHQEETVGQGPLFFGGVISVESPLPSHQLKENGPEAVDIALVSEEVLMKLSRSR